ncbi:NUDIX hydrolase [Yinghuangia sp. YIM S09857]|uniref:NUDIX hydrolase n=1 Tax=Yinghuangia sp. YIM S09857 TaxID=3436929 RepID=UPI003F531D5F
MTDAAKHSVSVAGVIVNGEGQVLLIRRRDNGRWEPPGGVLERHETIIDGLRREMREETGLEVEPLGLTGVYKNMVLGVVALVFRCQITGGHLKPNGEVMGFRWASIDDLPDLMVEAYRIRVIDSLNWPRGVEIRSHDGELLS